MILAAGSVVAVDRLLEKVGHGTPHSRGDQLITRALAARIPPAGAPSRRPLVVSARGCAADSGSLAMLAAMRRASSRVSRFAAERRPFLLEMDEGERLPR